MRFKYFAYGMNTNTAEMERRCPGAVSLGRAKLPGYRFKFATVGDVAKDEQSTCDGVLWDITYDNLKALDRLEGYPWLYNRKMVRVEKNGNPVAALVYYKITDLVDDYPSQRYYNMLIQGYTEHGVPTDQIEDSLDYIESHYEELHPPQATPTYGAGGDYYDNLKNYNDYDATYGKGHMVYNKATQQWMNLNDVDYEDKDNIDWEADDGLDAAAWPDKWDDEDDFDGWDPNNRHHKRSL